VRTFLEVFPASVLWYNRSELLLIGAADSLAPDAGRLALLETDARLHEDLAYSQWGGRAHWLNQPHAFLGGLLAGSRGLAAFAAGAELLRDDRPRLEYAAAEIDPKRSSQNERDFVAAIRPHLEAVGEALGLEIDGAIREGAARMQERNLGDIEATAELRLYRGLLPSWPPERLLPFVERAIAANPESADARLSAARLLGKLGQPDRAAAELQKVIAIRPDDPRGQRELAMLLHGQRRLEAAILHYRAALAARADAPTHLNLGAALLESGSVDEARENFEAALRLDPGLDEARRQLDRIRALGPVQEAS
jgi:tetratricopeptide (TPR) repeat protein